MKKLILLILFIPSFASAADITLSDVLGIFPNFDTNSTEDSTSIGDMLKLLGGSAILDQETTTVKDAETITPSSHEDYIRQFMFSSKESSASSTDIIEIANKIFGGDAKKKLANCISTEFSGVWRSGSYGEEVRELQKFLNQNARTRIAVKGPGSPGKETQYFGRLTVDAVKRFQTLYAKDILERVGLSNATGLWGPSTRKKANEITALCK